MRTAFTFLTSRSSQHTARLMANVAIRARTVRLLSVLLFIPAAAFGTTGEEEGPAAALAYELQFRGELCVPGVMNCYPDAHSIPFADTKHIRPMSSSLWRPAELVADFQRRMHALAPEARQKGIIVVLKTERCATKEARLCSVTTAALEKRSTPLLAQFEIYGLQLKPRDNDTPPGSLPIETGDDAWKNEAVREYGFIQGPGATLIVIDPATGEKLATTDAFKLQLYGKTVPGKRWTRPRVGEAD